MKKSMTMKDRVKAYIFSLGKKWKGSIPWVALDGRLCGIWILGNDYRSKSGYYGSYPPNYLERVMALFPDAERILHLFSGSLPPGEYTRFDIREDIDADVRGNAEELSDHFEENSFDLVIADPPYTGEDAEKYGTTMVNRNKVIRELYSVVEPGGFVVWLDQVLPMYRKAELELAGAIGIIRSTNHRFRVATFFRRRG